MGRLNEIAGKAKGKGLADTKERDHASFCFIYFYIQSGNECFFTAHLDMVGDILLCSLLDYYFFMCRSEVMFGQEPLLFPGTWGTEQCSQSVEVSMDCTNSLYLWGNKAKPIKDAIKCGMWPS